MRGLCVRSLTLLLLSLGLTGISQAKKPKDYPLQAHILSVETVNTRTLSSVSNLSTGVVTGSTWSGSVRERVEAQVGETVYILKGRGKPPLGADLPVCIEKDRLEILLDGKALRFRIVGQKEKPPLPKE